jgi:hypothetical protein
MSDNNEKKLEIVFARETFIAAHPRTGVSVPVVIGSHWPHDDAIVAAYPKFFIKDARYGLSASDPLGDDGFPVRSETADAAPGSRRGRGQGTAR